MKDSAPKKDRKFCGVIYPDSESYNFSDVKERIKSVFPEWALSLHDQDVCDDGTLKKVHVHWVARGKNPQTVELVASKLGLQSHEVEYCKSFAAQVRYLIHLDNSADKFLYDRERVESSFDCSAFWDKLDDKKQSELLFNYIVNEHCTSTLELAQFAFDNGCWAAYRRSFAVWSSAMREVASLNIS